MLQLAIILIFFIIMVLVGVLTRKNATDTKNFFVMGQKGTTLYIAGSLFATIIGASATLGLAGLGYTRGLTGSWWLLPGSLGLIVLGILFAKKVRETGLYTLPEIAAKQFGPWVGMAISIIVSVAWLGVIGGQIVAVGKIMSVVGIGSPEFWMVISTVAFVGFTVIGGQWAAIKTDLYQGIIIIVGIGGGLIFILTKVGGLGNLFAHLPAGYKSFPLSESFGWYDLAKMLLLVGMVYVVGPDIYSRILSAKDGKTARHSVFWTAGLLAPLAFGVVIIGMSAAFLFPGIPAEQAFPTVIKETMPPIVSGLVLGALLCAVMSPSLLLGASTIVAKDIIHTIKPSFNDKQLLFISRISVALMGALSLLVALYMKGIISSLLFAYTVFSSGVIPIIIVGFYREKLKITQAAALVAVIGGGSTGLVSQLLKIKYLDIGAVGVSVVLLFGVSLVQNMFTRQKTVR
ncbi:MAG: sodium:solute symporter family protein [Dehalococcoidales bacterium]|nr:sodium:solute symporter family protein [Dehalococcoidales bacterium]